MEYRHDAAGSATDLAHANRTPFSASFGDIHLPIHFQPIARYACIVLNGGDDG
jgi:hypothetical protein